MRRRRRGLFEGLPHVLYRRAPARFEAVVCALAAGNGLVVAGFGLIVVLLYVDLDTGEAVRFGAVWEAAFLLEGLAAAAVLRRTEAAQAPLAVTRHPGVLGVGVAGVVAAALVLAGAVDDSALLALPLMLLLYASCVILRYLGLELAMRPVLADRPPATREAPGVGLHAKLFVAIPMVTWGACVVVAGLLTDDTRDLETLATASLVAFAVTAAVSTWLSLVLADLVFTLVVELRDAHRRVAGGDLDARVAVVSTDETGELAASFNAMVGGLRERELLRDAFGTFVDPSLTERVLAEGTDLRGEEVEVTVLVADVRGFTAFAERAPATEVVARLNELYEAVVPIVLRHGGHANKFVGDGLLAVFGAPERRPDHARRAVAAALEIAALDGPLTVSAGVNSGRVVVGTVGGGGRRDFTVIGDPVNTAARVEAATRETGDRLLITEATLAALPDGDRFVERAGVPLKGKVDPVRLFAPR